MQLLDIVAPTRVKAPLEATDKEGAIRELVGLLAGDGLAGDADTLFEAVWTREQTRTTGIGHGLAIPHGKCSGMNELAMAIGKPATPLDFEAIDGKPVHLIVLLASPPDRTSDHIQALAQVSRLMTVESFRTRVYEAETPEAIFDLLREQEQGA